MLLWLGALLQKPRLFNLWSMFAGLEVRTPFQGHVENGLVLLTS